MGKTHETHRKSSCGPTERQRDTPPLALRQNPSPVTITFPMTGADRRHDEELQHRVGKPYSPTVHMFGIVWVCLGMFSDGKELKVCHGCTANTAPKWSSSDHGGHAVLWCHSRLDFSSGRCPTESVRKTCWKRIKPSIFR